MLVKRLKPIPVEAVVRGYLAGSGWKEYQDNQARLRRAAAGGPEERRASCREPIFTPAAKAAAGEHDENISYDKVVEMVGAELAAQIRDISIAIYKAAAAIALAKGMIIADTKFEFGLDEAGTLVLMDEVLTPDSLALLAGRGLRGGAGRRHQPAELRQAVRARLARGRRDQRQALGQDAAGAAPAGRGDREDRGQIPRGAAAAHRLTAS